MELRQKRREEMKEGLAKLGKVGLIVQKELLEIAAANDLKKITAAA